MGIARYFGLLPCVDGPKPADGSCRSSGFHSANQGDDPAADAWQIPAISEAFATQKLASVDAGDVSSLSEIGKKT
jgi:hypothetical protein